MTKWILCGGFLALTSLAACSTKPTITHANDTMTLAEINAAGLECRQEKPIDTSIPKTICASPESWAAFDKKRRGATEELLAKGRELPNVGRFNQN